MEMMWIFCRWFGGGLPENHYFLTFEEAYSLAEECLADYSPMVEAITNDYNNAVQFFDPDIGEFVGAIVEERSDFVDELRRLEGRF